jgi:peptide/nickel transport system ATP-binding protein
MSAEPVLRIEGLDVTFRSRDGRAVPAVRGVDLTVGAREIVGLVGGSGVGKSTVVRAVAGLVRPDAGRIALDGRDVWAGSARRRRALRRDLHLVLQDPYTALPPTRTVAATVAEPLVVHRLGGRRERVAAALEAVHLRPVERYLPRYPHQLSGGERQRVALARAIVTRPRLVLADEPTQMLDAALRAELVDLLDALRTDQDLAILHITHDLALAARSCSRLAVMHDGRVVERGATEDVLERPRHPYTAALVAAAAALHPSPQEV